MIMSKQISTLSWIMKMYPPYPAPFESQFIKHPIYLQVGPNKNYNKMMWKFNINNPSRFLLECVRGNYFWTLNCLLAGWGKLMVKIKQFASNFSSVGRLQQSHQFSSWPWKFTGFMILEIHGQYCFGGWSLPRIHSSILEADRCTVFWFWSRAEYNFLAII